MTSGVIIVGRLDPAHVIMSEMVDHPLLNGNSAAVLTHFYPKEFQRF
jgi:hypothetical protein